MYIQRNGQQVGPLTLAELKQGLQSGRFTLSDWAMTREDPHWKPLQEALTSLKAQASTPHITTSVQDTALQVWETANHETPQSSNTNGQTSGFIGSAQQSSAWRAFLNEEQDPTAVERVHARLLQVCTQGETVLYIAVQKKPMVTIAPVSIGVTDKRVLIFRPKAMGMGMNFEDYLWRNIVNIHINEALMGSSVTIQLVDGRASHVDYLPKAQVRRLYQFGQQMEEHMFYHRRDLVLEEKRAAAGNFNVAVDAGTTIPAQLASPQPTPSAQTGANDDLQKLQQLKAVFDQDLISQAEYDAKKAEIMARF